MKTEKHLKTIEVDQLCDKCKTGKMRPTGLVNTSDLPSYPHTCNNCDSKETYDRTYPYIRYEHWD